METTINIDAFDANFQSGLIFTIFEGLRPGESFKILSSHYPEPIKEQFIGVKVLNFKWEAQQLNSGTWETRIAKHHPLESMSTGCCGMCGGHQHK